MGSTTLATLTLPFIMATILLAACEGSPSSPLAETSSSPQPTVSEDSAGTREPASPPTTIPTAVPTPTPMPTSTMLPPQPTVSEDSAGTREPASPPTTILTAVPTPTPMPTSTMLPPQPTVSEDSAGTREPASPPTTIPTAVPTPTPMPTSTMLPPQPTLQRQTGVQRHTRPRSGHFTWIQEPLISNGILSFIAEIDEGYDLVIPTQGSKKLNVTIGCEGDGCGSIVPPSGPGWRWTTRPNQYVASTYLSADQTFTVSVSVPPAVATDSRLYICLWTGSNPNKLLGCSEDIDKE